MPTRPFILLPYVPTPQGRNSATFHLHPLDGTLSVPELFEYDAVHSPNHPLFVYPDPDAPDRTRTICYPEALRLIHRTALIVHGHQSRAPPRYVVQVGVRPHHQAPTIGILAIAGAFRMPIACQKRRLDLRRPPCPPAQTWSVSSRCWSRQCGSGSPRSASTHVIQLIVSPNPAM